MHVARRTARRTLASAAKDVLFGNDGRAAMARGVNVLARAVAATLGPKGRTVAIQQAFGAPKITKDGVTVARAISLASPAENAGASLLQAVAARTNEAAGDGTTTATVLARAIVTEGLKCIASGVNPAELRRGVQRAVDEAVSFLRAHATSVSTPAQLAQVATISANGDAAIGGMIARAMEKVGRDGVITVSDGRGIDDELSVAEGLRLDRGYTSPYFVNDTKAQRAVLEAPLVLLADKRLTAVADVLPAMEAAARAGRPLLVVAEDVDGEALAALVLNKLRGQLSVCAVRAPGFGDGRRAHLEDLAALTGATLFGTEAATARDARLDRAELSHLGELRSATVTRDDAVLLQEAASDWSAGESRPEANSEAVGGRRGLATAAARAAPARTLRPAVEARVAAIRAALDARDPAPSEYEREKLQERLARLAGGVAVLRVGGASEVELGERKDRFVDALNATRAAVEEGVVPGGGAALIKAVPRLNALAADASLPHDQRLGVRIVAEAIQAPLKTIVDNAGEHGAVVAGEILRRVDDFGLGYDAASGRYVDMVAAGIIDPLKVVRTALTDAASVATLLATTEALVVDAPRPPNANAGSAPPAPSMDFDD